MDYRCPLCLKLLEDNDKFERFCFEHSAEKGIEISFSSSNFWAEAHCNRENCTSNGKIDGGIFLRHIGCTSENPFWDGDKVDLASGQPLDLNTEDNNRYVFDGREIIHWQIGLMRRLPQNNSEMYFPLLLLRATTKEPHPQNSLEPGGVMIGLAGAKGVGKTVLAMQALDKEGYITPESKDDIEIEDFIYYQKPGGGSNRMPEALLLRSIMKRNETGVFFPDPTSPEVGDLKSVFIKKSNRKATKVEVPKSEQPPPKTGRFRGWFNSYKEEFKEVITDALSHSAAKDSAGMSWYAINFYDTAGEDNKIFGKRVRQIDEAVHKQAVFLDVTQLFKNDDDSRNALATTIERIKKLKDDKPICLVVTKLDLLGKEAGLSFTEGENEAIDKFVFSSQEDKLKLLCILLDKDYSENKRDLKRILTNRRDIPIFFIWHKHLPIRNDSGLMQYVQQPVSYGLQAFICWCLGINWDDVSQE